MNKKRLGSAFLFLLASTAALAESGLSLYGNIDASLVNATGIGSPAQHRTSFGEGNWMPSVWGLRGSEDLGGGMKALIQLEGGFSSATGAIANGGTTGLFSRLANVGLGGPFGTLKAGLNLSPFIDAYTATLGLAGQNFYVPALLMHRDGTALNAVGTPVAVYPGGADADPALGSTGGFFIPNSIVYSLPSELLAGATASLMYAPGGTPGHESTNRFISGNAGYSYRALNFLLAGSDRDAQYRQYLAGASAPFGPLKLAANFVYFNPEIGASSRTYTLGAEMALMPAASVGINYAHNDGAGSPTLWNLSAVYALSKSTRLYAAINRATDGVPSSYSGNVDGGSNAALAQAGSSNAVMLGIQKGF